MKDGRAGFIEFFEEFYVRNPIRDIEIVRAIEDGPYVFLHVVQTLNNGESRRCQAYEAMNRSATTAARSASRS